MDSDEYLCCGGRALSFAVLIDIMEDDDSLHGDIAEEYSLPIGVVHELQAGSYPNQKTFLKRKTKELLARIS